MGDKRVRKLQPRKLDTTGWRGGPSQPGDLPASALLEQIQAAWNHCDDLQLHRMIHRGRAVVILWLSGLVNSDWIQSGVMEPLNRLSEQPLSAAVLQSSLAAVPTTRESDPGALNQAIADGKAVVWVEGDREAVIVNVAQIPASSIDRPQNEPSVAGPQEAFVGSIGTDLGLVRKRVRNPDVKIELMRFGTRSRTTVALLYFDGIIQPDYVNAVKERLGRIHTDHVLSANYIWEVIRDHRLSLFPTMEKTERPDKVVAALVEGRLAIHVDGTPQALIAPTTLLSLLSAAEDYYQTFFLATFVRFIRQVGFWVSLLLPGLYIAVLCYNQDLIPTPLLADVARQHTGIPFPTVLEIFLLILAFEILREAGVRLPKAVGQSVSIVGALIIGEAAVDAGVVSPGAVIIVATTGVASFAIPSTELANTSRVLQFIFMLAASLFGLYGVVVMGVVLILHLASLDSFGVPYLSPYAPTNRLDLNDAMIRAPWWMMKSRPRQTNPEDVVRSRTEAPK